MDKLSQFALRQISAVSLVSLKRFVFIAALFNYTPLVIILPTSLTTALSTANGVTTLAIAIDRFHSVYWPIAYLHKNKQRYALIIIAICCICGTIELVAIYTTTRIVANPGCPSFGCFFNATFISFVSCFIVIIL